MARKASGGDVLAKAKGYLAKAQTAEELRQNHELIHTPGGTAIVKLSVGVHDNYRDNEGKFQTKTHWITVKGFRRLAEVAAEHLQKGSKIGITGRLAEERR